MNNPLKHFINIDTYSYNIIRKPPNFNSDYNPKYNACKKCGGTDRRFVRKGNYGQDVVYCYGCGRLADVSV